MALRVWIPLIDGTENIGLVPLSSSIVGSVTQESAGLLGPTLRIGSSSTDAGSAIFYNSNLTEELGENQTVMAWIKPEGDHQNYMGTIVSSGNWNVSTGSWSFGVNKTNTAISVFSKSYNRYVSYSLATGSWTHIACTREGTTSACKLYVNGNYIGQYKAGGIMTGSLASTDAGFAVGRARYASWCPFNGLIQDLRMYDEILSVREIQEIAKGLVAHYPLNDPDLSSNKLYDCSGNGYHGTCTAASRPVLATDSPRRSRCVKFDTTAKYFQITNLPALGGIYTFSWWGWWQSASANIMFWGYQNGNRLNMYRSGEKLYWNTGNGTNNPFYTSGTTVAPVVGKGVWTHYVITSDGTTDKLYVNGELYATAKTHTAITGTTLFLNGWDTSTSYKGANTEISDFRLYATALSADQVKELYDNPVSVCKSGNLMCMEVVE